MSFFVWQSKYATGIESIDSDHMKLVEIIEQIYTALTKGEAKGVIAKIVGDLNEYTDYHFSREEKIMKSIGYGGYDEHIKAHKVFTTKVKEYLKMLQIGQTNISVDVITFLRDWLILHIQNTDRAYLPDFNSSGIK
jgi:hemerythrin-like metal-binding protein